MRKTILPVLLLSAYLSEGNAQSVNRPVYHNPRWSTNGELIVFESALNGRSSIYTIHPDGKNLERITDSLLDYGQPAWSPDGLNLVYYGSSHPMQLFTKSLAGGQQQQLAIPGFDAYQPSWSEKNKIAFIARALGQSSNTIAVINSDGTGLKILTDPKAYDCGSPQWSRGGKRIFFVRSVALNKPWKDISSEEMNNKRNSAEFMSMNADGSQMKISFPKPGFDPAFCLAKNGKTIYYINKHDTASILFRIDVNEKIPDALVTLNGTIFSISVSPDGNKLVYAAERNKRSGLYIMDIKKKTEKRLTGD